MPPAFFEQQSRSSTGTATDDDPEEMEKRRAEAEMSAALVSYFDRLQQRVMAAIEQAEPEPGAIEKHMPGRHDQKTHGRKRGRRLSTEIWKKGGFSYHPITGKVPNTGYMVSVYPEYEQFFDNDEFTPEVLNLYLTQHMHLFLSSEDVYLGGWNDREMRKVYLDIVVNYQDKETAILAAREKGQEAIYDLENGGEIFVKPDNERRR